MGQKDIAEKTLEAYNDVFADIVNVLLFNGKRQVKEKDLKDATPFSIYKIREKLHTQERDVAKFWQNCNVRIALYGFENQTEIDKKMPLRVMSYDAASYKQQIIDGEENEEQAEKELYPVVSLILYFGNKRWEKPKSLCEAINISDVVKPFVSDYKINVFEIAYLSDEQVNMFRSDFKIVADYFVQIRKNKKYVPSRQVIKHVAEVLQLLQILTGSKEYEFDGKLIDMKGKRITMNSWFDEQFENAEKKGEKKGELDTLFRLMKKGILTLKQAAEEMGMSVSKFKKELEKHSLDYSAFV
jgi:hypothetical protein